MTVVTTRLIVAADGTLSIVDPLPAGEYVVNAQPGASSRPPHGPIDWTTFPFLKSMPLDPTATYSRQEIYGDDMR